MRTIPECREALVEIARQLDGAGMPDEASALRGIVRDMYRRPPVRKTRAKLRSLTPEIAEAIREDAERNPEASQTEIARRHGVNAGRVSEALAGRREQPANGGLDNRVDNLGQPRTSLN